MFQRNRNLYIKAQIKDVRVKRDRFEGGNQRISSKGDRWKRVASNTRPVLSFRCDFDGGNNSSSL
jgi:hypothetical protein